MYMINSKKMKIDALYFLGLTSPMLLRIDVIGATNLVHIEHPIQEDILRMSQW